MRSLHEKERMKLGENKRTRDEDILWEEITTVEFICPKEVAQEFPSSQSATRRPFIKPYLDTVRLGRNCPGSILFWACKLEPVVLA